MQNKRLFGTLVVLLGLWAQLASAEPRDAAFKASLSAERWQARPARWQPSRTSGGPQLEGPRINIHSVGKVIMVRSTVPQERGGVRGVVVHDFVKLRPAGSPTPSQVSTREAYDQALRLAHDEFALARVSKGQLHCAAVEGVLASSCTDSRGAYRAAISKMASSLNDKYTCYYEPRGWTQQERHRAGTGRGIGISMTSETGGVQVSRVTPGSPAEGLLRVGDQLLQIGATPVRSTTDVQRSIAGSNGQPLVLRLRRGGRLQQVTVQPREYRERLVTTSRVGEGIGVVKLSRFARGAADDVRQAVEGLQQQGGLRGLVLDLRGNRGGLTHEAHQILNLFIGSGDLFYFTRHDAIVKRHQADPARAAFGGLPLAVLVDGDSASSSEIVAGTLQSRGRAKLVGATTFGKGIAQNNHDLPDGGGLQLTAMRIGLALPAGAGQAVYYHGAGLRPDVPVAPTSTGDAALGRAATLLQTRPR